MCLVILQSIFSYNNSNFSARFFMISQLGNYSIFTHDGILESAQYIVGYFLETKILLVYLHVCYLSHCYCGISCLV